MIRDSPVKYMNLYFNESNIIRNDIDYFKVETNSGRSILMIFLGIFCGFFMSKVIENYIGFSILILCPLIWTYKKNWSFDKKSDEMVKEIWLLGMLYDKYTFKLSEVSSLEVQRGSNPRAGVNYNLLLKLRSEKNLFITSRSTCSELKPMINHVIRMFPPDIEIKLHEDCTKKQSFIRN